jgi:GNAT superfamily N-acetyltransferase
MRTQIVPVSAKNIEEALALLQKVFITFTDEEDPYLWFKLSIEPEKNQKLMLEKGVRDIRYFAVLDDKKIIGTTGLYHLVRDPNNTVWLGFYCLDESYRGKGLGRKILQWTVDKAKTEGNKMMQLYTSPNPGLETAEQVYKKFGFKVTKTEEKAGEKTIYMELQLE